MLLGASEQYPEKPALYDNLACAEARLGEADGAIDHLVRAAALEDALRAESEREVRTLAAEDEDLASLRADLRFKAFVTAGV